MGKNIILATAMLSMLTFHTSLAQLGKSFDGKASYYADFFYGRETANGEFLRDSAPTAAHKTLPFGTMVEVTNLNSGKSVVVRINDRGPYKPGRIIDLTRVSAQKLGIIKSGVVEISMRIVGMDGITVLGSDEVILTSTYRRKITDNAIVVR
jgi:rare lipoprotein A